MERQTQPFTCLTYVTTGLLLETLIARKSLRGYTHSEYQGQHNFGHTNNYIFFYSSSYR